MRCDELERWLDEGMPERDAAPARAHAAGCPRCAAAIGDAAAVEAWMLRPLPGAPPAFTDHVMSRIRGVEGLRATNPSPVRWFLALAEEPSAAIALAIVPVLLVLGLVWPDTFFGLVGLAKSALAAWLGTALAGAQGTLPAGLAPGASTSRIAFLAVTAAAALVVSIAAPLWMAERIAPRNRGSWGTRD